MTKLMGEKYCQLFYDAYGLETISLRYFNVFGPRQSLENEYAVVIPKFITCMLKNEQPPIYGDGLQSRDFTFVQNIVEANILACIKGEGSGDVYNAALGESKTVLEIVKELNGLLEKNIQPKFLSPRAGDVKHTLASSTKIREQIGWKGEIGFKEGIKITTEWFRKIR
jgi:UDP-glucose 4-epimerase